MTLYSLPGLRVVRDGQLNTNRSDWTAPHVLNNKRLIDRIDRSIDWLIDLLTDWSIVHPFNGVLEALDLESSLVSKGALTLRSNSKVSAAFSVFILRCNFSWEYSTFEWPGCARWRILNRSISQSIDQSINRSISWSDLKKKCLDYFTHIHWRWSTLKAFYSCTV
jgi:hypothetical protein